MTNHSPFHGSYERPEAQGLFDPALERDACGVGFIANLKGKKSHQVISDALKMLCNLEHRGAVGADPLAGDGAGILIQIPHAFLKDECGKLGIKLPEPQEYAVGQFFMPQDERLDTHCQSVWERVLREEGLDLLGWRSVPVDNSCLSELVRATEPVHRQIFIARPKGVNEAEFERIGVAGDALQDALAVGDVHDRAAQHRLAGEDQRGLGEAGGALGVDRGEQPAGPDAEEPRVRRRPALRQAVGGRKRQRQRQSQDP